MNTHRTVRRRWNAAIHSFAPRLATVVAGASLALAACSGGGGGGMSNPPSGPMPGTTSGVAMVSLTDMPGDFLSYLVNVVSIKLTRADGTVVETVPVTTQVDFAQLVNLSEVISAQQVPVGSYSSVSMTLDYSGATLIVDNGAGGITVPAANIINGSTSAALVSPNSQVTLTLQLPSDRPLVITQGTVANLALDFNLSASNTVAPSTITSTTAASAVMVTVSPMLSASITPDVTRQIRVRGTLVSVTNTSSAMSYTVNVHPFFTANQDGDGDADDGQVVVDTSSSTSFILNGKSYTGSAGLTALGALGAGTPTSANGTFDTQTSTFTAATVYAGSSVPGAGLDSASGTVTARSGNVLTLSNGFLEPRAGAAAGAGSNMASQDMSSGMDNMGMNNMGGNMNTGQSGQVMDDDMFSHQLTVTVASTTAVTEDGQSGTFGPQNISVGQHLTVFGTFSMDGSGNRTLDATAGSAQLAVTPLWGQFSSSASGVVTVNLLALDNRPASIFNFAGTGSSSANDATTSAYTVSVPASLQVPQVSAGFPIQFFGFVTAFGSAPPDFSAVSLVNFSTMNGRLRLDWAAPGVTAPFTAPLSATNVVISQTMLKSAMVHEIQFGFAQVDPASVATGLSFVPDTSAQFTVFAIAHAMSWKIEVFSTFDDFITALTGDLNGTTAVLRVDAEGPYDQSTGVMSVSRMGVELSQ